MSRPSPPASNALDDGDAALLADFDSYLAGETITPLSSTSPASADQGATTTSRPPRSTGTAPSRPSPSPSSAVAVADHDAAETLITPAVPPHPYTNTAMEAASLSSPTSSSAEALAMLSEVFPNVPVRTIRGVLGEVRGNPDHAAALLATREGNQLTLNDAEIAERLQRVEIQRARAEAAEGRTNPTSAVPGPTVTPRKRSSREHASSSPLSPSSVTPGNILNPQRLDPTHPLTPEMRKEVLIALRNVIVPSLRAHFDEITFHDYHVQETTYSFSLEQVSLSALSITSDSITVRQVSNGYRVHVVNIFVEVDIGRWQYLSRTLFGLKDQGSARVSVNGLAAGAMLLPRWAGSSNPVFIDLGEVDVNVEGQCRLRTEGSNADWAYNAVAVLLKPLVVSYIKNAVEDVFSTTLSAQLHGWIAWSVPRSEVSQSNGMSAFSRTGEDFTFHTGSPSPDPVPRVESIEPNELQED